MKKQRPFTSYADFAIHGIHGLVLLLLFFLLIGLEAIYAVTSGHPSFIRGILSNLLSSLLDNHPAPAFSPLGNFGLDSLVASGLDGHGSVADFLSPGNRNKLERFILNVIPPAAVALGFTFVWTSVSALVALGLRKFSDVFSLRTDPEYLRLIGFLFGVKRNKNKFHYPLYGNFMRMLCLLGVGAMAAEGAAFLSGGFSPLGHLIGQDGSWLSALIQDADAPFPPTLFADFFWIPLGLVFYQISRAFPVHPASDGQTVRDTSREGAPDIAVIKDYLQSKLSLAGAPYRVELEEFSQPWNLSRQYATVSQELYQRQENLWIRGATRHKDILNALDIVEFRQEQLAALKALEGGNTVLLQGEEGAGLKTIFLYQAAASVLHGEKLLCIFPDQVALDEFQGRLNALIDRVEWLKRTILVKSLELFQRNRTRKDFPDILYYDASRPLTFEKDRGSFDFAEHLSTLHIGGLDRMDPDSWTNTRRLLGEVQSRRPSLSILTSVEFGSLESSFLLARELFPHLELRNSFALHPEKPSNTALVLLTPHDGVEVPPGYEPDAVDDLARTEAPAVVMAIVQNFGIGPVYWDSQRYGPGSATFPALNRLYSLEYVRRRSVNLDWVLDGTTPAGAAQFGQRMSVVGMGNWSEVLRVLDRPSGADAENERIFWFVVDDSLLGRAFFRTLIHNPEWIAALKQASRRWVGPTILQDPQAPRWVVSRYWIPAANLLEPKQKGPMVSSHTGAYIGEHTLEVPKVAKTQGGDKISSLRLTLAEPLPTDPTAGRQVVTVLQHLIHLYCQYCWRQYEHDLILQDVEGTPQTLELTASSHSSLALANQIVQTLTRELADGSQTCLFRQALSAVAQELESLVAEQPNLPIVPGWLAAQAELSIEAGVALFPTILQAIRGLARVQPSVTP